MAVVWKFPLALNVVQKVEMPVGARIVHVDVQARQLWLWAFCRQTEQLEERTFYIFGTGHEFDDTTDGNWLEHVGTALMNDDTLVLHVFDGTEIPF